MILQDCVGLMSIFAGYLESLNTRVRLHLISNEAFSFYSPGLFRQLQYRARKKLTFWVRVIFQILRG
jgi:hypothetical protein